MSKLLTSSQQPKSQFIKPTLFYLSIFCKDQSDTLNLFYPPTFSLKERQKQNGIILALSQFINTTFKHDNKEKQKVKQISSQKHKIIILEKKEIFIVLNVVLGFQLTTQSSSLNGFSTKCEFLEKSVNYEDLSLFLEFFYFFICLKFKSFSEIEKDEIFNDFMRKLLDGEEDEENSDFLKFNFFNLNTIQTPLKEFNFLFFSCLKLKNDGIFDFFEKILVTSSNSADFSLVYSFGLMEDDEFVLFNYFRYFERNFKISDFYLRKYCEKEEREGYKCLTIKLNHLNFYCFYKGEIEENDLIDKNKLSFLNSSINKPLQFDKNLFFGFYEEKFNSCKKLLQMVNYDFLLQQNISNRNSFSFKDLSHIILSRHKSNKGLRECFYKFHDLWVVIGRINVSSSLASFSPGIRNSGDNEVSGGSSDAVENASFGRDWFRLFIYVSAKDNSLAGVEEDYKKAKAFYCKGLFVG